jgi:hypothetical protein
MYDCLAHPAWRAFFKKYRVKVTESWAGREGLGMNAVLWAKNGTKKDIRIANIHDAGNGGCYDYLFFHPDGEGTHRETDAWKEFLADVEKLPKDERGGFGPMSVNDEIAIDALACIAEIARKRGSRGNKPYFMVKPGLPEGDFQMINLPKEWSLEQVQDYILEKSPNSIVINELF